MHNRRFYIDNYQYVSFDIFDTLIKRSVAKPTDIFVLVEQYCLMKKISLPSRFAEKRMEVEKNLSNMFGARTNLDMIYNELRKYFHEYADLLKDLEIQFELDGCRKNDIYTELLNECIDKKKTIILISDMYLSSDIIKKILAKSGISGYKKLYISCESNATKRSGELFRIVLRDLKISPTQLIHFGDNYKSDFLIPLSMGIKSIWIKNRCSELCKVPRSISMESKLIYRTVKANIENCSYNMPEYRKEGCEILGPLLFGFVQWLLERLMNENIRDVYFMSRDGYILKQAFDVLGIKGINTHYLYASRRSYQVPLIWKHSEFNNVIQPFIYVKRLTLREFLLRIGLKPEEYEKKALEYDLDMNYVYEKGKLFSSSKIMSFYNSIKNDVIENSLKEYEALSAYIESLNMEERIAVVDVGYHGTIQYALEQLIEEQRWNIEVVGYYVGVARDADYIRNSKISAKGYLYYLDDGIKYQNIKANSHALYEIPFLAPHGSVKRFTINNLEYKPEFEPFEYENNEGRVINELYIVSEYQKGAVEFVKYMNKVFPVNLLRISPDIALAGFNRLVTKPTLGEAKVWGDFRFINYVYMYIARPQSLINYLFHPKRFLHEFMNCSWKIGFMRRLFVISLPYKQIHDLFKAVYKSL